MAEQEEKLVKRSDKLAFLNTGTAEEPKYERMRKFTELSKKIQMLLVFRQKKDLHLMNILIIQFTKK